MSTHVYSFTDSNLHFLHMQHTAWHDARVNNSANLQGAAGTAGITESSRMEQHAQLGV